MYNIHSVIKFRVWDSINNTWFKTVFDRFTGETREIFMSQNGEMYLREVEPHSKVSKLTIQNNYEGEPGRYIPTFYAGMKDKDGQRYYFGDIVQHWEQDGLTVLVMHSESVVLASGKIGDFSSWQRLTERELRLCKIVGNVFEHADKYNQERTGLF